jgi:transposase
MATLSLQPIKVVENVAEGRLTIERAADLLGLSRRQVQRLKKRFEAGNVDWVYHGNQGRTPANRIPDRVRNQVVGLAKGLYAGFNDHHLQEKPTAQEGISLSRQSVRRILRSAGLASPQKRRPRKYRSRRERRSQEGMMPPIDGSRHDWLEGRGPMPTLLGAVDDATGKVPAARFQLEHEDAAGYLRLLRELVETHGVPLCLYRDRHGTLQRNDKHWSLEEELTVPRKWAAHSKKWAFPRSRR